MPFGYLAIYSLISPVEKLRVSWCFPCTNLPQLALCIDAVVSNDSLNFYVWPGADTKGWRGCLIPQSQDAMIFTKSN